MQVLTPVLTLADWIRERYPALLEVGEPHVTESGTHTPRPGIVHRLDKETSGAVLIAKDQDGVPDTQKTFSKGEGKKRISRICIRQTETSARHNTIGDR